MKTPRSQQNILALAAATFFSMTASHTASVRAQDPGAVPESSNTALFQAEHAQWLKQREAALSTPDGWLSLIGLHWLEPGTHSIGSAKDNAIVLAIGPARLGKVTRRGDAVFFTASPHAELTLDGRPLHGETALQPENRDGTTKLKYDGGKGQISVIGRGDKLALRVRHADAPTRLNFTGLNVFPADADWRVQARFIANPPGTTLPIVNLIGDVSDMPNPGYVQFEKDGRHWTLQALGDPAKGLNLSFQDRSSGRETYGVGRYLHTGAVGRDGTLSIDFNRATNPPCAYTDYATCPLPPPENRLAQKQADGQIVRLAVLAGEKAYTPRH